MIDAHDPSQIVVRYACDCGHLWWGPDTDTRECRKCGGPARPVYTQPTTRIETYLESTDDGDVMVRSRDAVVYEGREYQKAVDGRAYISGGSSDSVELKIDLGKIPPGRVGYMVKWMVVLLLTGAVNGVLDSQILSFGLSVSWLLWMFNIFPILLVTMVRGPVRGGLLEQLEDLADFEWVEELFAGKKQIEAPAPDPEPMGILGDIRAQYFKGIIDADKMETLMGASAGVIKDQERLRLLLELEDERGTDL